MAKPLATNYVWKQLLEDTEHLTLQWSCQQLVASYPVSGAVYANTSGKNCFIQWKVYQAVVNEKPRIAYFIKAKTT